MDVTGKSPPLVRLMIVIFIAMLGTLGVLFAIENTCGGTWKPDKPQYFSPAAPTTSQSTVFDGHKCVEGEWEPQWKYVNSPDQLTF